MRGVLRALLLVVALVLEFCVLAACASAAYRWPDGPVLQVVAALLALLVMGLLWGLFAAPRAARPLRGMSGAAFRVAWFGIGVLATGWVVGPVAAFLLAAASLVGALGLRLMSRDPARR